jgi:hypothetical protein
MTLLLNNMASTGQGEEYLFPQQQMVYHTRNISAPPEAQGYFTQKAFAPGLLFVEWSDDSINDFIGQYPAFLPLENLAGAALTTPVILSALGVATAVAAPPATEEPVQFSTVDGVQSVGPLTIPVGFQFNLTGVQITATYAGPVGVAQFIIDLGQMAGPVIAVIWAQMGFTLQKTLLADNPSSTQVHNYPSGSVVIGAGAIPAFIYEQGPAGVTFSGTVTGSLVPTP